MVGIWQVQDIKTQKQIQMKKYIPIVKQTREHLLRYGSITTVQIMELDNGKNKCIRPAVIISDLRHNKNMRIDMDKSLGYATYTLVKDEWLDKNKRRIASS